MKGYFLNLIFREFQKTCLYSMNSRLLRHRSIDLYEFLHMTHRLKT